MGWHIVRAGCLETLGCLETGCLETLGTWRRRVLGEVGFFTFPCGRPGPAQKVSLPLAWDVGQPETCLHDTVLGSLVDDDRHPEDAAIGIMIFSTMLWGPTGFPCNIPTIPSRVEAKESRGSAPTRCRHTKVRDGTQPLLKAVMRLGGGGAGTYAFPKKPYPRSKPELRSTTSCPALAYSLSSSIGQLKLFFSISLLKLFLLAAYQIPTNMRISTAPGGSFSPPNADTSAALPSHVLMTEMARLKLKARPSPGKPLLRFRTRTSQKRKKDSTLNSIRWDETACPRNLPRWRVEESLGGVVVLYAFGGQGGDSCRGD